MGSSFSVRSCIAGRLLRLDSAVTKIASAQERRRQVHALRAAGNDWATIAETVGIKEATCKLYLAAAIKEDGLPKLPKGAAAVRIATDDEVVTGLAVAANPFLKDMKEFREACKRAGLRPSIVNALERRMKVQYGPVVAEGKRMLAEEILPMLQEKIQTGAGYLDDYAWSTMSGKDIGVVMGILIDRHELLSGRPTQRVDFTARLEVAQSLPMLMAEARRRGIELPMVEVVRDPG